MPAWRRRHRHLNFVRNHMALNGEYSPMLLKGKASKTPPFLVDLHLQGYLLPQPAPATDPLPRQNHHGKLHTAQKIFPRHSLQNQIQ